MRRVAKSLKKRRGRAAMGGGGGGRGSFIRDNKINNEHDNVTQDRSFSCVQRSLQIASLTLSMSENSSSSLLNTFMVR